MLSPDDNHVIDFIWFARAVPSSPLPPPPHFSTTKNGWNPIMTTAIERFEAGRRACCGKRLIILLYILVYYTYKYAISSPSSSKTTWSGLCASHVVRQGVCLSVLCGMRWDERANELPFNRYIFKWKTSALLLKISLINSLLALAYTQHTRKQKKHFCVAGNFDPIFNKIYIKWMSFYIYNLYNFFGDCFFR